MMKIRINPAVAALLALSACASAPPNHNDNLIVPGERVGNVELGMSLSSLLAMQGAPIRTIPIPDTRATTYNFDGLTVAADEKVYWIIAKDPRFHTEGGVAKGAEQIYTRAIYGKPKCVVTRDEVTVYDYDNIYFEVDNVTGKVKQIGVQRRTSTCSEK
ncbi:MAG TPA: hypothetical protein PLR76_03085 [Hyphomonas sp.]|nr:hypothetical protein [Hyphomonas sp.]